MADNSRKAVAIARFLAIVHIVVGSLLIIFGIADSVATINGSNDYFWTGYGVFGVWIDPWAGVFMGFSITSAVFGGIIINYNGTILAHVDNYYYYYHGYNTYYRYRRYQYSTYDTKMALSVIFLILGIAEFGMGIWAAICLCVMKPCCGPAQGPTVAFAGIPGQRMALRTDGVQVAFPVQPAGGALPVQASYMYAQGMQATSAPMPIGASGGPTPPQLVVGAGSPQEMGMELQHGKYIPV
ncbi:uncharacterized protein [Montipora capricornis]|uniref:uncharacterized protein isoform X2 n=1 Tax=Montipora capricornis TaxID=246305 RepID=UPI0035F18444